MDINIITDSSFSVYITKDELLGRGLSPADVEPDEAKKLIETVLGRDLGSASVELYSGGGDLMVFVERLCSAPRFYRFSGLEALIDASRGAGSPPSSLFLLNGEYILSVRDDRAVSPLDDFGERLSVPQGFSGFLYEHGRVIIAGNALSRISSAFSV